MPELERQAREKLVVEAEDRDTTQGGGGGLPGCPGCVARPSVLVEDKVRATAAASIEKEIRDRLRKEAEERIKAELPVRWMHRNATERKRRKTRCKIPRAGVRSDRSEA